MKSSMQGDNGEMPEQKESLTLAESVTRLLETRRRQLAELLTLFTLETRYVALMLGVTLAMAVISALAAFSAWGLLQAAALTWLLASDWHWSSALAMLALANCALILVSLWLMRRALARIGFDSTRRALGLDVPDDAD
jgi:hypothetical protein